MSACTLTLLLIIQSPCVGIRSQIALWEERASTIPEPAFATTMQVLAANAVEVMISPKDEYTPTPVISHAILRYNKGRQTDLADGIVITPLHNPPADGGFKYKPPNGGSAGNDVTNWIENKANELHIGNLKNVKRISFDKALRANTTYRQEVLNIYVSDFGNVIDRDVIRDLKLFKNKIRC